MPPLFRSSARKNAGFGAVILASTFLMGSSFVATQVLLKSGLPPLLLSGCRFFLAAMAALPFVRLDRGPDEYPPDRRYRRDIALVLLIGLLQTAAVMSLVSAAMRFIDAPTVAILLFTNPLLVMLFAGKILGERFRRVNWMGMIVGCAGIPIVLGGGVFARSGEAYLVGEGLALAAAACWAAATIAHRKFRSALGPGALNFWQMLVGALTLMVMARATGEGWPSHVDILQMTWFLWLAIPASAGSFGLWFLALSRGGATKASSFLFLAPLFTSVLAIPFLGSAPGFHQLFGGALVGLGLWMVNHRPHDAGPCC